MGNATRPRSYRLSSSLLLCNSEASSFCSLPFCARMPAGALACFSFLILSRLWAMLLSALSPDANSRNTKYPFSPDDPKVGSGRAGRSTRL